MKTRMPRLLLATVSVLFAGLALAQVGQHRATPLESARITIEDRARADGYVRLRLQPQGGQAVETIVDVLARMSENDIAADIEKAMTLILDERYEVSRGGGENVRIQKSDKDTSPDFTLEISFNTPGLTITIQD